MASKSGDVVLGGRHLVGIFVALVVLFAGVFTLGYLMGRNQGAQLSASAATAASQPLPRDVPEKPEPSTGPVAGGKAAPQGPDWDFYHSNEPGQPAERLTPQPKPAAARTPVIAPAPVVPEKTSARRAAAKTESAKAANSGNASGNGSGNPPLIPRGTVVLQVAAVARQSDALALAQALQQKKFPAFVLNPASDHYYRVQVGPYRDGQAANVARQRLEEKGFKSIVKR